jgi:hypothetical protein
MRGGACQSTVRQKDLPTYFAVLAIFAQFDHEEFALNLAVAYILSEFLYIYKRACIVGNFCLAWSCRFLNEGVVNRKNVF